MRALYPTVSVLCLAIIVAVVVVLLCMRHKPSNIVQELHARVERMKDVQGLDVVVALHEEDCQELLDVLPKARLFVYHKGTGKPNCQVERLPNVGREAHTYLHHICEHYHNMSEITLFAIGTLLTSNKQYGETKQRILLHVLDNLHLVRRRGFVSGKERGPFDAGFKIDSFRSSTDTTTVRLPRSAYRPLWLWYKHFIGGDMDRVRRVGVTYNGTFAVCREAVHQYPLQTYIDLRNELARHNTSESVHFMERSWCPMLSW